MGKRESFPRSEVVRQTIALLERAARKRKQPLWGSVAAKLRGSRRKRVVVNLWKISDLACDWKGFLLVPGKVLGFGELEGAVNVIALDFSATAKRKISEKGRALSIVEALEGNVKPRLVRVVC